MLLTPSDSCAHDRLHHELRSFGVPTDSSGHFLFEQLNLHLAEQPQNSEHIIADISWQAMS